MASPNLALCLLLVWAVLPPSCCQHWSYGLNPGGKRDVDGLADAAAGDVKLVEVFRHVDTPCGVWGCAEESPIANIYRSKGFRDVVLFQGSVTNRESGHITY
uniref:Progonadoliberin n=1 Tax=Gasterosteus aculeatus aculeatus TaxID=481459 RepID=A0AAQ4S2Q5_GASAC